uniref:ATP synthase F0 subunit 8 n=1 Tax=Elephantulus rupestris TaxID=113278 RepID=UPI002434E1E1|nr:ATP synthase F0 subunit 8 [Elephantulus rupestris]WEW63424.1 ATP synthase F0 subunit 8 [Elephantulus rupestris]
MPQLDTSTWFITIISMLITLFILLQIILSKFYYPLESTPKSFKSTSPLIPWETKWTKIYLPHL